MNKETLKVIIISVVLILGVLLHNIFSIFLENIFGNIVIDFLVVLGLVMVGAVIFSLIKILVDKKYVHFILIFAVGITTYLLITQSFRSVGINIEYKYYSKDRQKIVKMFEEGKIKHDINDQYVKLPEGYTKLSKFHGLMMVDNRNNHLRIGFVVENSYFTRHQIVIYVAGDGVLKDNDFGEELRDIRRIDEHWYEATAEVMM